MYKNKRFVFFFTQVFFPPETQVTCHEKHHTKAAQV